MKEISPTDRLWVYEKALARYQDLIPNLTGIPIYTGLCVHLAWFLSLKIDGREVFLEDMGVMRSLLPEWDEEASLAGNKPQYEYWWKLEDYETRIFVMERMIRKVKEVINDSK